MGRAGAVSVLCVCGALALWAGAVTGAPRYSSRIVRTASGALRGVIEEAAARRLEPVEVFRGVPYGGRPLRLAAPPPPPVWPGTRLADNFAPVCPQRAPLPHNRTAALARMPLAEYELAAAAARHLTDQSEDCLYLNIYVPGSGSRGEEAPYGVLVWAGGPSLEWGSGNLADGGVLAARGHLVVVTLNYRLGLLGMLPDSAGRPGAALMDGVAALRWVRDNIAAFGGDSARVTLAGTRDAALYVNTLLMMPELDGSVSGALLLSGSSLAPLWWREGALRSRAARELRCGRDDELATCVRARALSELVNAHPPRGRFLPEWRPPRAAGAPLTAAAALHASPAFLRARLALVLTSAEGQPHFSEREVTRGLEERQRAGVLRRLVGAACGLHRAEVLAAVRNEYTDWDRPVRHPANLRDATLEAVSDATVAAPAVRLARLHSARGGRTYLAHFAHRSGSARTPARLGSVPSELPSYVWGAPLLGGNYSRGDVAVSERVLDLVASFVKSGRDLEPAWPRYDPAAQRYLTIGPRNRPRSHYRGHKLALWLHLVPQLHRPGGPPDHHRLREVAEGEEDDDLNDHFDEELYSTLGHEQDDGKEETTGRPERTEADSHDCSSTPFVGPTAPHTEPPAPALPSLDHHYYKYGGALSVSVCAGGALLLLNGALLGALVLAGRRRGRATSRGTQRGGQRVTRGGQGTPSPPQPPPGPAPAPALHEISV